MGNYATQTGKETAITRERAKEGKDPNKEGEKFDKRTLEISERRDI